MEAEVGATSRMPKQPSSESGGVWYGKSLRHGIVGAAGSRRSLTVLPSRMRPSVYRNSLRVLAVVS